MNGDLSTKNPPKKLESNPKPHWRQQKYSYWLQWFYSVLSCFPNFCKYICFRGKIFFSPTVYIFLKVCVMIGKYWANKIRIVPFGRNLADFLSEKSCVPLIVDTFGLSFKYPEIRWAALWKPPLLFLRGCAGKVAALHAALRAWSLARQSWAPCRQAGWSARDPSWERRSWRAAGRVDVGASV